MEQASGCWKAWVSEWMSLKRSSSDLRFYTLLHLSRKPKKNVGDFKFKKRGHNQGNDWVASTLHSSVSFLEVMWSSGIVHVAPGTKMHSNKRRGWLNDMINLYCSACSKCTRKVTLSCYWCRDKRGGDCSWHYITCLFEAFMNRHTEKLKTNKKDIQKLGLPLKW